MFKQFMMEEKGQGLVEYALIIGLIAVAVVVVLGLLGTGIGAQFTAITNALSGAS